MPGQLHHKLRGIRIWSEHPEVPCQKEGGLHGNKEVVRGISTKCQVVGYISVIHARIMIMLSCVVSFIEVGVRDKRYERNPQCLEASLQLRSCRGPVENLFCHIWCEPDLNLRINKSINTFFYCHFWIAGVAGA